MITRILKKRYRADTLLEERAAQLEDEGKEAEAKALLQKMAKCLDAGFRGVRQIIIDENIKCPVSNTANWTEVRQFNLMFSTQVGAVSEDASLIYLRPETAQGIFVNFLNVQKTGRMKVPLALPKSEKPSVTRSLRVISSSVCGNSNKWRCNSSFALARKWNGIRSGKKHV